MNKDIILSEKYSPSTKSSETKLIFLEKTLNGHSFSKMFLLFKYKYTSDIKLIKKSFSQGKKEQKIFLFFDNEFLFLKGEWIISIAKVYLNNEIWIAVKRKTPWVNNPFSQLLKLEISYL